MTARRSLSRRDFIATTAVAVAGSAFAATPHADAPEPIIDIHQHTDYGGKRDANYNVIVPGRSNEDLIKHQRGMGVTKTIMLAAGHPYCRPSTHNGRSNGLESTCTGNEFCYALAKSYPKEFAFSGAEVPDVDGAAKEIEKYLKLGAVIIGEQKFGVDCDSPEMQRLYAMAADYNVPILLHWQHGMYTYGLERFYKMLQKFPRTNFINHAQTWWANIDKDHKDQSVLYPKGKVTPGGLSDKYLSDYPNCWGDHSAGSGLNALTRDEEFTREFLKRHQDRLLFGSDCTDTTGQLKDCIGAQTIATIRRLAPSKAVERKILHDNAKKLFRF